MNIRLHKNARTTPAVRAYIRDADKTQRALAYELGVGIGTIRKWQRRESTEDRSHISHNLQQGSGVVILSFRFSPDGLV
ncbi:hypothetical protein [Craterilacuibacter sp. RT1T]|uniref:hypothetical protein n=1 Tax=Craterilacuibacter sp. RT1T TaxID=2942211 RepID=UPI0020BD9593|nr:hypothetical protein [Craterilacuibacter sp. RT1T]MCL6264421.1 hypothetical protein [Craterilacuibacter sp. RT1T]